MTAILVCAEPALEPQLSQTMFWRDDLERYVSESIDEARMLVFTAEPHIVVVDLRMPNAAELIADLRSSPFPHQVSIVVLYHGGGSGTASGADASLSWPPGPGWDARLTEILKMPTRQQVRYEVHFDIEAWLRLRPDRHRGVALNISSGGLLAQARASLHVGDDIELRMPLPGDGPVEGRATVVRQPIDDRLAVRFDAFRGNGDARVREYIAALANGH